MSYGTAVPILKIGAADMPERENVRSNGQLLGDAACTTDAKHQEYINSRLSLSIRKETSLHWTRPGWFWVVRSASAVGLSSSGHKDN